MLTKSVLLPVAVVYLLWSFNYKHIWMLSESWLYYVCSLYGFEKLCAHYSRLLIVRWLAHSSVLPFLEIGMRIDLWQSYGHGCVFLICWHIECSTMNASSFWEVHSSTGIPSHPLALLTVELPKALLTSHSRMPGSGWLTYCLQISVLCICEFH